MQLLLNPANSVTVGALSFIIGCLGLVVSFAGLGFALYQLSSIKKNTEVQSGTISIMRERLVTVSLLGEATRADSAIRQIRAHLIERETEAPYSLFDDLALSLENLAGANSSLPDEIKKEMKDSVSYLDKLSGSPVAARMSAAERSKQAKLLRDYSTLITRIMFFIQESGQL